MRLIANTSYRSCLEFVKTLGFTFFYQMLTSVRWELDHVLLVKTV